MRKLGRMGFTFLAILMLFISFSPTNGSAESKIKVGILGPMTGPGSLMGQGMRDGALMVFDEINASGGINGKKIDAVVMDDQAQITLGINATKKLVYKDEVLAIIGTPNSPVCLATMKISEESETPQIMFGVAPKITQTGNKWFIRVTPSDQILAGNFVKFATQELKLTKVAILHDSSDYGKGGLSAVEKKLEEYTFKPVIVESFNVGDKDFSAQLNKIKNSGAEGVFLWGLYVEGAQIVTQAKQLGLSMPFFASSGVLQGAFLDLAGKTAEGLYVVTYFSLDNPDSDVQAFLKAYRDKYQRDPTPTSALAYDGANVLVNAVKKAGLNKKNIMEELRSIKGYNGVTGLMEADDTGQAGRSSIIMQIKDGKPVVVWSSD
jgi:branched-chain amino acid transport system substrate-binding protein